MRSFENGSLFVEGPRPQRRPKSTGYNSLRCSSPSSIHKLPRIPGTRISHSSANVSPTNESKADKLFGEEHGCLPTSRLINERPLGIDRLQQIWEANSDHRLMELFLWHFRRWGNTLDQVFLGTQAFGTIEPINLQTVLSTKFDGSV